VFLYTVLCKVSLFYCDAEFIIFIVMLTVILPSVAFFSANLSIILLKEALLLLCWVPQFKSYAEFRYAWCGNAYCNAECGFLLY
jgi:hypothetical protein